MADRPQPRSWQLVQAMVECLQQIRSADGYRTDAGAHVTDEPAQIPDDGAPIVLAVIIDATTAPTDPNVPPGGKVASIAVLAKVACGPDDGQETLHAILDDVDFAVQGKKIKFPGQTTYPRFVSSTLIPAADGVSWMGVEIRYASTYLPLTR